MTRHTRHIRQARHIRHARHARHVINYTWKEIVESAGIFWSMGMQGYLHCVGQYIVINYMWTICQCNYVPSSGGNLPCMTRN